MDEIINEEPQEESKFKKVLIIIIALFLLLIFLTYIITNAVGIHILSGLIESSKVTNNTIDFSFNNQVIFINNSLEKLQGLWISNPELEFKVCLQGIIEDNKYVIYDVYQPETFSQKVNEVVSEPCKKESLIDLHSHPFKHCLPSQQDLISFNKFKETQPKALMAIMCEPNRFTVYD